MPQYKYVAVDPSGNRITGVLDAPSLVNARNDLLGQNYDISRLKERKQWAQIEITTKKLKPEQVMHFSRQLGAFLKAGIPILDALETLEEDTEEKQLKQVLTELADDLRSGASFADAISAHAKVFPPYYVAIIRSAELTGSLDLVLNQLARYVERDFVARRSVKSALTYPLVILGMAIVTITVLVTYVLPKFTELFKSFDAKLPLATRALLNFTDFLSAWWPVLLLIVVGSATFAFVYFRTQRGRLAKDRLMLRIPALGGVVEYAIVERFCRILGATLRSGVPINEAMTAATEATHNRVYKNALETAHEELLRGQGIARPIADTGLFPGAAVQMLKVGEQSGTLDDQLEVAADFYEVELDGRIKRLTTLFEPAIIVVMGLIVGFVAIALVSAMYGIFNQVTVK